VAVKISFSRRRAGGFAHRRIQFAAAKLAAHPPGAQAKVVAFLVEL
jgi:hypothetical protein